MEDHDKPAERWIVVRDGGSFLLLDTVHNEYLLETVIARYGFIRDAENMQAKLNALAKQKRGSPCD